MRSDPACAHIGFGPASGTDIGVVRPGPGEALVSIKLLAPFDAYTEAELRMACMVAGALHRGPLILFPPYRP